MPSKIRATPINVLMVSQYLFKGGGARAAVRIFQALKYVEEETNVRAHLHIVRESLPVRPSLSFGLPSKGLFGRLIFWARILLGRVVSRFVFRPEQTGLHSTSEVRSGLGKDLLKDFDLVHLNWLSDASLSIEEVGEIPIPVVWTLHDMWLYCGAEHTTQSRRFVDGYYEWNQPESESGPDVNRLTWERKLKSWNPLPVVVSPSAWAAGNARSSALFRGERIEEIPHPIDVSFWAPAAGKKETLEPISERAIRLGLPAPLDSESWGKGLDLLGGVLDGLDASKFTFEIYYYGGQTLETKSAVLLKNVGTLDDLGLRELYRSIDILIFPSVIDTFGLVAQEAQACGTPVVCFAETGVASIVDHQVTGWTAVHRDISSFVQGVMWLLASPRRLERTGAAASKKARQDWSYSRVGNAYARLFRSLHNAEGR